MAAWDSLPHGTQAQRFEGLTVRLAELNLHCKYSGLLNTWKCLFICGVVPFFIEKGRDKEAAEEAQDINIQ